MRTANQAERFPQSALLFKFCLAVLQARSAGGKAHDQDLGNILNYNASDTSHWKRGKKAVKSVHAIEALARKLDADFETLHDLSEGSLDFEEAWFEFSEAENLRKLQSKLSLSLQKQRAERAPVLEVLASQILARADVGTIPVYVPEVVSVLPFVEIAAREVSDKLARATRVKPGFYSIRYRKGDMRAHTRVAVMREIARIILHSERAQFGLPPRIDELLPFEVVDLSNALLVPMGHFKAEYQKVPVRMDVVSALADTFWVPKSVIRGRLTQALVANVSFELVESQRYSVSRRETVRPSLPELDFSEDDAEDVGLVSNLEASVASLN
jgi:hypothetical protein